MTLANRPSANVVVSDDQPADPSVTTAGKRQSACQPLAHHNICGTHELADGHDRIREVAVGLRAEESTLRIVETVVKSARVATCHPQ